MNRIILFFIPFQFILSCARQDNQSTNIPVSARDNTPCNPNASENTVAILRYIANLSEDPFQGVISGQSCGHACNTPNADDLMEACNESESVFIEIWISVLE